MFYLLFLPMIVVATRHGVAGVAATLPMVQLGLIGSLVWVVVRSATVVEFQLLMLALSFTALYLGALADGHREALGAVQRHEITLREQQRALEQTLRAAGASEMASTLAHELNQPLSAIGTYARVCRMQLEAPQLDRAQLAATLEKVSREATRGGEYVRRMRDFFRSGSTRLEHCDLTTIVQSSLDAVADRAAASAIRLNWEPPRPAPMALVDRMQVESIMHNLLINAIDALTGQPAPRQIDVRAFEAAGRVQIEVADSGPGIAEELGETLFTPLATTKPHGMGLGLAISRSTATALGGELWHSKEQPRTTFCLRLPAHGDA
jgi:C4-dicarboxylate-specific signal transduction histidine kinase